MRDENVQEGETHNIYY